ncbi:MAG: hypothetical protein LBQ02_00525 [Candidatus Nomurabacteria bacterium]|jgi:hypothetical protein|nr:hypothetical protein [Candidatus Nomurabacteria bacterium]
MSDQLLSEQDHALIQKLTMRQEPTFYDLREVCTYFKVKGDSGIVDLFERAILESATGVFEHFQTVYALMPNRRKAALAGMKKTANRFDHYLAIARYTSDKEDCLLWLEKALTEAKEGDEKEYNFLVKVYCAARYCFKHEWRELEQPLFSRFKPRGAYDYGQQPEQFDRLAGVPSLLKTLVYRIERLEQLEMAPDWIHGTKFEEDGWLEYYAAYKAASEKRWYISTRLFHRLAKKMEDWASCTVNEGSSFRDWNFKLEILYQIVGKMDARHETVEDLDSVLDVIRIFKLSYPIWWLRSVLNEDVSLRSLIIAYQLFLENSNVFNDRDGIGQLIIDKILERQLSFHEWLLIYTYDVDHTLNHEAFRCPELAGFEHPKLKACYAMEQVVKAASTVDDCLTIQTYLFSKSSDSDLKNRKENKQMKDALAQKATDLIQAATFEECEEAYSMLYRVRKQSKTFSRALIERMVSLRNDFYKYL